jgi:hypothetical protein
MDDSNEVRGDEKRRVLEMLEQGRISAAEADELLVALQSDSAADGPQPAASAQTLARRPGSVSGLPAVAVVIARVLAKTIGRLSFAFGRVVGTLAGLFGRARTESNPRDR